MAAIDDFGTFRKGFDSPYDEVFLITPDNGADLASVTRGISFGSAGDLKIAMIDGGTVTIPSGALAVGVIHPIRAARVYATGTTAGTLVGYY